MPSSRLSSIIAPSGQTTWHPPQLWQSFGKTRTFLPTTAIALKRQICAHFRHNVHRLLSTAGTKVVIVSLLSILGCRNRWTLGSSTSQSRSVQSPPRLIARLVETVVLPVPPLPLAMLMIIAVFLLRLHRSAARTVTRFYPAGQQHHR